MPCSFQKCQSRNDLRKQKIGNEYLFTLPFIYLSKVTEKMGLMGRVVDASLADLSNKSD